MWVWWKCPTSTRSTFRAAPCRKPPTPPTPPKEFNSPNSVKIVKNKYFYNFKGGGVRRGVKKHVKIGQKTPIYRKVDLAIAEP